jgi:thiol-disulfide isomerase/thioredoxin
MREFSSMVHLRRAVAAAFVLAGSIALRAQVTEASLAQRIDDLRAVADAERPGITTKIATDIRSLPAGPLKVRLADGLASLSTEGDPGHATLQAVADTLAKSLKETPQPPEKDGSPATAYMDLAKLVRYEGVQTDLVDPMLARAGEVLASNDAGIADTARADFTLMDTSGRKHTLSALKGRIVLVNFWATWCPPCRKEMKDLDAIYTRYKASGVVVMSLTSEGPDPVISFLSSVRYSPPVLIDEDGAVAKQFHVVNLPRTFVYDRSGKLVAEAIDMRTRRQFFDMLAQAGLRQAARGK